ncbi:MAG TPA: formate dehydrogenase [Aquabacterium sp.]|nr:formate dehydrogenase [Aquabacterium sp.]HQC97888.1 formate dehydrogenase [Aquabacterium sp.]
MRKTPQSADTAGPTAPAAGPLSRRRLFAGAGTAGALAAAAAVLPLDQAPEPVAQAGAKPDDTAGGYRLSAHVQQYYRTAKV